MRTLNLEESTHSDLKRLALDEGKNLRDTANEAILIGIEKMRARLEAQLKKRKAKR